MSDQQVGQAEERTPEEIEAERDPNNAANKLAISAKSKRRDSLERKQAEVVRRLLADEDGRAWLADLVFNVCKIHGTTENAAYDTNGMHYREGARAVGLILQDRCLRADLLQYMVLQTEYFGKM